MKIDAKFLNRKCKFSSAGHEKDQTPWSNGLHSRDTRFDTHRSGNIMDHTKQSRIRYDLFNRCWKPFDKIPHLFMVRTLGNRGVVRTLTMMAVYTAVKATASVTLRGEACLFLPKSGTE